MRGAPQSTFSRAHALDQGDNVAIDLRTARSCPRFPAPIGMEACAVPLDQCRWPHQRGQLRHLRPQPIAPNQKHPVAVGEPYAFRCSPSEDSLLVPQPNEFGLQCRTRSKPIRDEEHELPREQNHRVEGRCCCSIDSRRGDSKPVSSCASCE